MKKTEIKGKEIEENNSRECFVIMPIGDKEGYSKGHFKRVYEDIFKPAIVKAGFKPYRADDSNASHLIQIDIIERVIKAPMAICDLSTRNPNVLFELGIRQAFDKPVVLVQEVGTERIFDINSINTHEYRKERVYNEVLEDQEKICDMIKDTFEKHTKGECVNSLVKLINMQPAKNIDENFQPNDMMKVIFSELMGIKKQLNDKNFYNVESMSCCHDDDISTQILIERARYLNNQYKNIIENESEMPIKNYYEELKTIERELGMLSLKLKPKDINADLNSHLYYGLNQLRKSINRQLNDVNKVEQEKFNESSI
ncbi:hypothetical protein HYH82_03650 [Clostridium botulinum]|uniref:hypothetical protein n=1 Tax=Clostridium botulinum TaxID=1491 RepID=UPI001C9AADD2|nr:hypothetical protein [Clostridium botulinum]MBY6756412.1 hypothetical protein [Clostridium botulinum]